MPAQLPIYSALPDLRAALSARNTVILEAPPGSGKSTIVPWELLDEPWLAGQKIIMLEPRRLAARTVAERMAFLLGEKVGERVGYRIRFETKVSRATRIEVVTEGILTRMLQEDNALQGTGVVIFDEFHERSLHADLALALARESQKILREDLRLLIMSATMDTAKLSQLLSDAPVVKAEGRQYPVAVKYISTDDRTPLPQNVAGAVMQAIHEEAGDVLVFLPGAGEIRKTESLLAERVVSDVKLYPLYGDLSSSEQQAAIVPDASGRRKVILSTSIAETSLTIEGVGVVIDSGFSRVPKFDPKSGLSKLATVRVTRDSADQRAGRAGRLGPGVAYRLWTEAAHHALLPNRTPEILEADLTQVVLDLANWGVEDPNELTWLTPPPTGAWEQAKQLLESLGAMEEGRITELGRRMSKLPAHPRIAHMLIESERYSTESLACDLAALLEEKDILSKATPAFSRRGQGVVEPGADMLLRVEALQRSDGGHLARINRAANQWRRIMQVERSRIAPNEHDIARLIAAAYPERIARRIDASGKYRLANGRTARLPDHDPLASEEWLAIAQMDAGFEGRTSIARIFLAAALDADDALQLAKPNVTFEWNEREGVIKAERELRVGEIVVKSAPVADIPDRDRIDLLAPVIRREGLRVLNFTDNVNSFRARVESVRAWRPEDANTDTPWPDMSDAALLATLEEWLGPSLTRVRKRDDLFAIDLYPLLLDLLTYDQRARLNALAPQTIEVPSGSSIALEYRMDGAAPVLAVRLQELFGCLDTPTVNQGRTKVLVHLLSPGYKPVQVTQDLRSFWQNGYPQVRKELRIRYQKHSWPEDPWTAQAVRGVKRKKQ